MQISALLVGFALVNVVVVAPQESGLLPAEPAVDLGGVLIVGDVEIPQDEIKRFLIYGPGRPELEDRRTQALIERGIEQRILSSRAAVDTWRAASRGEESPVRGPTLFERADFEVSGEEFQELLDEKAAKFKRNYPTLDWETELRRAYRSRTRCERTLRQGLLFDRVFVPDDPEYWLPITFEALRAEAGEVLINDFRQSYERRRDDFEKRHAIWRRRVGEGEGQAESEPRMLPEDPIYRTVLRQIVRDRLSSGVRTETALEGLPPALVCTMDMDGDDVFEWALSTNELWTDIEAFVTAEEILEARRFLALIEATRQHLSSEGKLLTEEAAAARFEEIKAMYVDTESGFDPLPGWVPDQFPSLEAYAEYHHLLESYRDSSALEAECAPGDALSPALRGHLDFANHIMGWARVNAAVLLVSAYDFPGSRWKEDGWTKSLAKAESLAASLRSDQESWPELLEANCEFWAPPEPAFRTSCGGVPTMRDLHDDLHGSRNYLRSLLEESPYSNFLNHGLLTDKIFFDQPVGTVGGPYEGPWGYYLIHVFEREAPTRLLNLDNEEDMQWLRESWIRISFIDYAHEALASAEVRGTLSR